MVRLGVEVENIIQIHLLTIIIINIKVEREIVFKTMGFRSMQGLKRTTSKTKTNLAVRSKIMTLTSALLHSFTKTHLTNSHPTPMT